MRDVEHGRSTQEPDQLPECVTLWWCIGCGAMGNSKECIGTCRFEKLEVVPAEAYADLFEMLTTITDALDNTSAVVSEIANPSGRQNDTAHAYKLLQARARDTLLAVSRTEAALHSDAPATESAVTWLCAVCGQVEAPQPCIGVCVRRTGDFVRVDEHRKLAGQVDAARRKLGELATFLRRLVRTTPREGQSERTLRAFQEEAKSRMISPSL